MITMSSRAAKTARDLTLGDRVRDQHSRVTIEGAGSLALPEMTARLNAGQLIVCLNG
jgi:hypothetical protein